MDSDEIETASSDDSDRAESSSAAMARLDLTRIVREVVPPLSHRTRVRCESHAVPVSMMTFYSVLESDISSPAIDVAQYHMKLLTQVDIGRMFVGTSKLRHVLDVALQQHSYLVMLSSYAHTNPEKKQVAEVQVAPCVSEALALLGVGFALNVRYPDGSMRVMPLHWTLSEEKDQLLLELVEQEYASEIVVVSKSGDDLVFFDVHFTRAGVCLPNFVVMRASMAVGEFGQAVIIDKMVLQEVFNRLYTPSRRFVTNTVTLESFERIDERHERAVMQIPAMVSVDRTTDPRTPMVSASHYSNTEDFAFTSTRDATPYERWQSVTKTYRTSDGWFRLLPSKNLNRECRFSSAELHCGIYVNIDDSIHEAQRQLWEKVYLQLKTRHLRHCQDAAPKIIQMSAPATPEFGEADDVAYLTTDEEHVAAINRIYKGKQPRGPDPDDALAIYCFVVHRYRTIFEPEAFANITFPPHIAAMLATDTFVNRLAADKTMMEQNISRYIIDGLLSLEDDHLLERKVHLRKWTLQCPVEFVGVTLTKMIDGDIYRTIWERHQREYAEIQRLAQARARNVPAHGVLRRMATNAAWLFGACSGKKTP